MADYPRSGQTDPLGKPRLMDLQGDYDTLRFPVELGKQGGMGFQFEGGIITVTATPTGVDVNFDRPMIYDGSFTPAPPENPFDITQPTLSLDAKMIDIPIVVAPISPITLSSVTPAVRQILLTFNVQPTLNAFAQIPANWIITPGVGGVAVTCTGVLVSGNRLYLTTTEATNGIAYTVTIPTGSITAPDGWAYLGDEVLPFTAVGDVPTVVSALSTDANNIVLIFNEEVDVVTASNPTNYSFNPPLTILSVTQVDSIT